MPSPLPGMDPYLEDSRFWSSFHSRFIVALADAIEPQLKPEYYIEVETRTYLDAQDGLLVGIPDAIVVQSAGEESRAPDSDFQLRAAAVQLKPQLVEVPMPEEVTERFLEIRDLGTGEVVTVIELLSLKNKRSGPGRISYEEKRLQVLGSLSHLVEIDLLRGGSPMTMFGEVTPAAYRVLISPSHQRPQAELYSISLQEPLPEIPIYLKPGDDPLKVNLQAVLDGVYDRGRYGSRIDYSQAPPPPSLSATDQAWLQRMLPKT